MPEDPDPTIELDLDDAEPGEPTIRTIAEVADGDTDGDVHDDTDEHPAPAPSTLPEGRATPIRVSPPRGRARPPGVAESAVTTQREEPQTAAKSPSAEDRVATLVMSVIASLEIELAAIGDQDPEQTAQLNFEIGRLHEERFGDLANAKHHYSEARLLAPDAIPTIQALRRIAEAEKDHQTAHDLYDVEVRAAPDARRRSGLLVDKARYLESQRKTEDAELTLLGALSHDPNNQVALEMLARLLRKRKEHDRLYETLGRLATAIRDPSHRSAIYTEMGLLAEAHRSDEKAARESYGHALEASPGNTRALEALLRLEASRGRDTEVAHLLKREAELTRDPGLRHAAHYFVGHLQAEILGAESEAAPELEAAAELLPSDALAFESLADLYRRNGRWRELAEVLSRLLAVQQERTARVTTLCELAEVQSTRLGDHDGATRTYRTAVQLDPTCIPALQGLGALYRGNDQHAERIELDLQEADRSPDPVRRADRLCQAAEACEVFLGDSDRALEIYQRARHIAPDNYPSFLALDRLLSAREQWTALADLYKQEANNTADARRKVALLLRAAQLYEEKLENNDAAAETLRAVIQMAPENVAAMQSLARLTEQAGKYREVIDLNERQAALLSDDREICSLLHGIGRLYEDRLEDPERAITAYNRVLDRFPRHARTYLRLGRLLEKLRRWRDLAALYEKQIALEPNAHRIASLQLRIGRLQETQLALTDEAAGSYRRALQANPDYHVAQSALMNLHRGRNEWKELAKVLEDLAGLSQTPEQTATKWLRIGEIRQEHLKDLDGAAEAYHEALRKAPGYDPASRALLRLHGIRSNWSHLAASLGEEAARVTDSGRRITALLQLADLYANRLSDPQRAAACHEEVLTMQQDNADALRALLPLYRRLKRWPDICAAATRIAHTTSDPAVAAAMLTERAMVAAEHGVEDPALVHEQILQVIPGDPTTLEKLERIYRERQEHGHLARILEVRSNLEQDPAIRRTLMTSIADALVAAGAMEPARQYYANTLAEFPTHLPTMRALRGLVEASGDHAAIADLLEQEAEVLADESAAVNALVRAGELRNRLRDTTRARSDFERVLVIEPSHDAAFTGLTTILAQASDFRGYAEAYRTRIDALGDDPRAIGLRLELAETLDRRLRDVSGAVAVLQELLQRAPSHRGALDMLASIFEADERWPETVETYERIAEISAEDGTEPDPARYHHALLRLGALRFERLADPMGAIRALYTALRVIREDPATLALIVAVHRHEGDWQRAADALQRLIDVCPPEDQIKRVMELAEIREQRLHDGEGARELLVQAVKSSPRDPMALSRLERHFERSGHWDSYAEVLEGVLEQLGSGSTRASVPLRIALAKVYSEYQDRVGDAARQLQQAVQADPADPLPRLARARLHLRPPPRLDHAALELREVLKVSPWSRDAYRLLEEVFRHQSAADKQACAGAAYAYLEGNGGARADEALASSFDIGHQLGYEAYLRLCAPREEPVAAREVLAEVEPGLAKLFPPDLGRYGVDRSARISAGNEHPLRMFAEDVASALGIGDFSLYIASTRPIDVGVEPEDPPAIIVGARVPATATPQELKFLIGRAMSRILARNMSLARLGARELMATLGGLCDQFDLNPTPFMPKGVSIEEARQLGRALMKQLPRKTRKSVEIPVRRMYDAHRPDAQKWQMLTALGSCRVGLICSGSIGVALEAMRRFDVARGRGEPGPAKVEDAPSLLVGNAYCENLLRYSVSDDYFEARRKLGISARPRST